MGQGGDVVRSLLSRSEAMSGGRCFASIKTAICFCKLRLNLSPNSGDRPGWLPDEEPAPSGGEEAARETEPGDRLAARKAHGAVSPRYASRAGRRHQRSGHRFPGRFKAQWVDRECGHAAEAMECAAGSAALRPMRWRLRTVAHAGLCQVPRCTATATIRRRQELICCHGV